MVKISSDQIFKSQGITARDATWREATSVTWLKLNNLHSHVDLISNCNVGNVYTDNQVYNKPSFWFNLVNSETQSFISSLLKILILDILVINLLKLTYLLLTFYLIMGFRSFYFVYRHTVRNYGSALMSRNRLTVTQISFSSAGSASFNSSRFVACSGLF